MKALIGFLAAALFAFAAPAVVAQSLRVNMGNGTAASLNGAAPPIPLIVRDSGGNPRAGVTVTFESACIEQTRGEAPPYPCVTSAGPLDVVTNASGFAPTPPYTANGTAGNAWVRARADVDGVRVETVFYWRIGAASSPVQIVTSGTQLVQVNFPMEQPLVARVVNHNGLGVGGVPVFFISQCAAPLGGTLPCITGDPTGAQLVSDAQGYVRSGIRTANGVAGNHEVQFGIVGMGSFPDFGSTWIHDFQMINVAPVRSKAVNSLIGMGSIFLEMKNAPPSCSMTTMEPIPDTQVSEPPALMAAPRGRLRVIFENCTAGATIKLSLQHADGMPEGSRVWQAAPEWQPLDSTNTIEGFWEFSLVDGGKGDPDGKADGRIETVLAVAFGDPAAPNFQDLWWVGPIENGWGMSIVQHGLSLFVVVFAYDASGEPTWYVMPGGSWNATAGYSGALYSPRGKPISQHVSSNLVVGSPVGSATIEFYDVMSARLILRINGKETVKYIQRQMFGAREARILPPLGDMWWAGAGRSGWGLVLQQQRASLFGLLFTYRADGMPTWFVLPTGLWTAADTYEGLVYRTRSSAWPDPYDASKLVTSTLGAFKLRFTNGNVNADFNFSAEGTASQHTLSKQPF